MVVCMASVTLHHGLRTATSRCSMIIINQLIQCLLSHLLPPFHCVSVHPGPPQRSRQPTEEAAVPGAWTEHRRNNRRNIDGTTEHRRNIDGTSTELRITYERAPPRTRGGRGPEGTGKALKPPQPKRKSKFYVFDGTHSLTVLS